MVELKLQADSKFLQRLLDVAASGVGAIFRPWMIRRIAHAEADAALIAAAAEEQVRLLKAADVEELPNTSLMLGSADDLEGAVDESTLVQRTQARVAAQELKRQRNIETVIWQAAAEEGPPPPDEQPDLDWIARFFGSVQDVSAEELQEIWSKILAGEIRRPGTFSLRTLDRLKNLSQGEAKLFAEVANFFEENSGIILYGGESGKILPPFARLIEAGLLHDSAMWKWEGEPLTLRYLSGELTISLTGRGALEGLMDVYSPTSVAGELMLLIERQSRPDYVNALKEDLRHAGYLVEEPENRKGSA